jgi:dTDP-4-amino-4,6-dideoxygalactose transaminase
VATFSFYPGKNLGAYGDAGAIATNDDALAARMRTIANHGGKNDHSMEGRNSRLDSLQAAILSTKLKHLEDWTEARRRNADLYRKYLADSDLQVPVAPDYSRHVYHLFVVQVPERDRVQAELKARGIETGIHYPIALPFLKAYAHKGHTASEFPVAAREPHRILSLPMYAELTEEMIANVCAILKDSVAPLAQSTGSGH